MSLLLTHRNDPPFYFRFLRCFSSLSSFTSQNFSNWSRNWFTSLNASNWAKQFLCLLSVVESSIQTRLLSTKTLICFETAGLDILNLSEIVFTFSGFLTRVSRISRRVGSAIALKTSFISRGIRAVERIEFSFSNHSKVFSALVRYSQNL